MYDLALRGSLQSANQAYLLPGRQELQFVVQIRVNGGESYLRRGDISMIELGPLRTHGNWSRFCSLITMSRLLISNAGKGQIFKLDDKSARKLFPRFYLLPQSMEAVRKIAVIGAGGVGGYFGGRLAQLQDECQVHFVVRGETLQVLKRDGLRVDSLVGDFHIPPDRCNATGSTPSLLLPPEVMRCSFPHAKFDLPAFKDDLASVGPVDLVITAVKVWQLEEVARTLQPLLHSETIVVRLSLHGSDHFVSPLVHLSHSPSLLLQLPLQNGVEAADILARALDKKHVVGGFCKIISYIVTHGHIRHDVHTNLASTPRYAPFCIWGLE